MSKDARPKIAIIVVGGIGILTLVVWQLAHRTAPTAPDAAILREPAVELPDATIAIADGASDAQPPSSAECAALEAANAAIIHATAMVDGCAPTSPSITCSTFGGASWGFRIRNVVIDGSQLLACQTRYGVALERMADGGAFSADAGLELDYAWYTRADELFVRPLCDYDGDGIGEVEVVHTRDGYEGHRADTSSIWTVKNGTVVEYAPARGIAIDDIDDIDGDGREDLLTRGPYEDVIVSRGPDGYPAAPAWFAAHSKPNGTFVLGDVAAIAYAKRMCPSKPNLDLAGDDPESSSDGRTVVCARLWGATTAEVDRAVDRACADAGSDKAYACDWSRPLGKIAPPFTVK